MLARCWAEELHVEEWTEVALDRLGAVEAGYRLYEFMDAMERGGTRPMLVERICALPHGG